MGHELHINKTDQTELDECLTKGICSVNPGLSALHEVVLLHLKELAFYLLKLKELGGTNAKIKEIVLDALSSILAGTEYTQEQFHKIIIELDTDIEQTKMLYKNFCESHNLEAQFLKLYFKHGKDFSISEAQKKGEKYSLKKNSNFTTTQKNLYEIALFLIKSMCLKIIEYKRLGKENDDYYYATLSLLNIMNIGEFSEEKIKEEIEKFIKIYYQIIVDVFYAQIELYGQITPTEVSFSTAPGKAILVSGTDYKKLELILKATEGKDISIYTHGAEMLMAHSHPKLQSHSNLKGHFGTGTDSSIVEFAEFQGPILMTKLSLHSTASLFRGRLYTLDSIAAPGIYKIKDYDMEPIIKSAIDSKGFEHGREKPSLMVGYSEEEVNKKIDEIIANIQNQKIKHLYIIGLNNHPSTCPQYFETFFKVLPKDCYAISLACKQTKENVFHIDSFFDLSLFYKILKRINQKMPLNEIKMSVFVTKCDKHTIATLLHLKQVGIKNIYMNKCPSMLINPALIKTLQDLYDIKEFSDARIDIKKTLEE